MIKNLQEFNLTHSTLAKFNERKSYLKTKGNALNSEIEIAGINAISKDLKEQLKWYSDAKNGRIAFIQIDALEDLPQKIIGKRIQLGFTQEFFAKKINMSADDYIRLENNDFYGMTSEQANGIFNTLALKNPNHILSRNYGQLVAQINSNLKVLNIDNKFVSSIMPISLEQIKEIIKENSSRLSYILEEFLESFKRVFNIDLEKQVSPSSLNTALAVAFKRRVNVDENNLTLTTSYAAYLANIIANQMNPTTIVKADPISIRSTILHLYEDVSIESCLHYIWSLNIAVLPLHLHGSFHGACFDFESTRVITLSQQNKTVSRWKFDMLHELYHALTMEYTAYIERTEIMDQDDKEEQLASSFASYVIFGQEMDSFLKMVLERSGSQIERMKSTIASVASDYSLNIDDFSNYVAYRISKRPVNLWGVAANLQQDKRDPAIILRNYLYHHIDISEVDTFELEILQKALNQEVK